MICYKWCTENNILKINDFTDCVFQASNVEGLQILSSLVSVSIILQLYLLIN